MSFLCSISECANAGSDCCAEKEMRAKPPTQVSDFPNHEEIRMLLLEDNDIIDEAIVEQLVKGKQEYVDIYNFTRSVIGKKGIDISPESLLQVKQLIESFEPHYYVLNNEDLRNIVNEKTLSKRERGKVTYSDSQAAYNDLQHYIAKIVEATNIIWQYKKLNHEKRNSLIKQMQDKYNFNNAQIATATLEEMIRKEMIENLVLPKEDLPPIEKILLQSVPDMKPNAFFEIWNKLTADSDTITPTNSFPNTTNAIKLDPERRKELAEEKRKRRAAKTYRRQMREVVNRKILFEREMIDIMREYYIPGIMPILDTIQPIGEEPKPSREIGIDYEKIVYKNKYPDGQEYLLFDTYDTGTAIELDFDKKLNYNDKVFTFAEINSPADIFALDELDRYTRGVNVQNKELRIPFMTGLRSDKPTGKSNYRYADEMMNLLNFYFPSKKISMLDPHGIAPNGSVEKVYPIYLYIKALYDIVKSGNKDFIFVYPDATAYEKYDVILQRLVNLLDLRKSYKGYIQFAKVRNSETQTVESRVHISSVLPRLCTSETALIIIDDIIDGGRSITNAVHILNTAAGLYEVDKFYYVIATHIIQPTAIWELLELKFAKPSIYGLYITSSNYTPISILQRHIKSSKLNIMDVYADTLWEYNTFISKHLTLPEETYEEEYDSFDEKLTKDVSRMIIKKYWEFLNNGNSYLVAEHYNNLYLPQGVHNVF